jgi:hypothetical protein
MKIIRTTGLETRIILAILFASLFLVPYISSSFALTDSICGTYGLNANQTKTCLQSYLSYSKMNHMTDKQMQAKLDQFRQAIRQNQVLQNVTQYHSYVIQKPTIAYAILHGDLSQKAWYDTKTKMDLNELAMKIKNWKTYDHNVVPVPATCSAWHICNHFNIIPINHTSIELKPQFSGHESGFINGTSQIKNMTQLQTYMTENKTR